MRWTLPLPLPLARPASIPFPRFTVAASLVLLALAGALAPQPALAQDDPVNRARGLSANAAYLIGDIDAINLYNGNLTVALPLGGSYPVGGPLSYGLALHYNSGVWNLEDAPPCRDTQPAIDANLDVFHNAGIGWRVSLGELYPPNDPPYNDSPGTWLYVSADGSKHSFSPTLHNFETVDPNVFYSRDGTYLRLKLLANGSKTIELPNGLIHTFGTDNRLTQMAALYKSGGVPTDVVNVTYLTNEWDLADSQGRVQRVYFRAAAPGLGQVDHVTVTAFGGTTATYQLTYADTSIARHRQDSDLCDSDTVTAPLLQSLRLPDGSLYSLTYALDNSFINGNYQVPGTLISLTLPTFGRFDYVYQAYSFRHPGSGTPMLWVSTSDGILTKTTTDVSGASLGTWTYQQATRLGSSVNEQRLLVTSPLGHQTYHYFNSWGGNWTEGLPFSPDLTDSSGTHNLSTEAYRGAVSGGALLRSTYLRFTDDSVSAANHAGQAAYNSFNGRVESQRTVYWDDGGTYADVDYSAFDGLGHYRAAATSGNFPGQQRADDGRQLQPGAGDVPRRSADQQSLPGPQLRDARLDEPVGARDVELRLVGGERQHRLHLDLLRRHDGLSPPQADPSRQRLGGGGDGSPRGLRSDGAGRRRDGALLRRRHPGPEHGGQPLSSGAAGGAGLRDQPHLPGRRARQLALSQPYQRRGALLPLARPDDRHRERPHLVEPRHGGAVDELRLRRDGAGDERRAAGAPGDELRLHAGLGGSRRGGRRDDEPDAQPDPLRRARPGVPRDAAARRRLLQRARDALRRRRQQGVGLRAAGGQPGAEDAVPELRPGRPGDAHPAGGLDLGQRLRARHRGRLRRRAVGDAHGLDRPDARRRRGRRVAGRRRPRSTTARGGSRR